MAWTIASFGIYGVFSARTAGSQSTFRFTDSERAELSEFGAITTDERGREILVGLTHDETAFLMAYERGFIGTQRDSNRENGKKYVALMNKHLLAWRETLGGMHATCDCSSEQRSYKHGTRFGRGFFLPIERDRMTIRPVCEL